MQILKRHVMVVALLGAALLGTQHQLEPVAAAEGQQAPRVTSPMQQLGHNFGDDGYLATYTELQAYWATLDQESDRMQVVEIGRTAEGRPHLMSIVTSPENQKQLDKYRDISRQLALAEDLTPDQARDLARQGKSVIWIDGGLHATEVLGAQQLMETVYQLVSRTDAETMRILNDVIILLVHANPDGHEWVSTWYRDHGSTSIPVLYQKYAGHDNNRDFYMAALDETINMNRIAYREWFPQVIYNHHQTGPSGTVMFAPPFRDPHNYFMHPLVPAGIDMVGSAMATRFLEEGKPGVTSRAGANYSTWWNGGLRTTAYFHNMIGILTETIGRPEPIQIPFVERHQISDSHMWMPIQPTETWHFRQSVDYSVTANYAILDLASRYRETMLYRIYQMGADQIRWGSEDHWTFTPHKMERIREEMTMAGGQGAAPGGRGGAAVGGGGRGGRGGAGGEALYGELTKPEHRDPRGFILPADQPDFGTAVKLVNALIKGGVAVHQASASFTVGGKTYPANSLVVKSAQAFRAHVLDMFEPQDHPDDIPYPGGAPRPPYDSAGWTLAYQMGVQFDRILDGFDGPFVKLTDFAKVPAGAVRGTQAATGYYFSHKANDSAIAVNRLLAANEEVSWLFNGPMGYGTFYVAAKPSTRPLLEKAAADLGLTFEGTTTAPTGPMAKLRMPRIGLYDQYGGSMPSGWTRLILENFEFPYEVVYPPMLDAGDLRAKYDVLVFNDGGLPAGGGGRGGRGGGGGRGGRGGGGAAPQIPEEYARRMGSVTPETIAKIREFVEAGGSIIAIGSAANGAVAQFELPVTNHLVEVGEDGEIDGLPREKYYVPGSVLRVAIDETNPIAHGLPAEIDVFFDNSPVFRLGPQAPMRGVKSVAWFDSPDSLRSGWAWGEHYLEHGVAAFEGMVGKGRVFVFGPEILFRSQPHGTFKFFFNGLYLSAADGTPRN